MAEKITDLLGSYDNFDEEPDYLNNPTNILAVTITFMVSYLPAWLPTEPHFSLVSASFVLIFLTIPQILSWICALLRLYTRFLIVRSPGWDDVFVILSLVSASSRSILAHVPHPGMRKDSRGVRTDAKLSDIDLGRLRRDLRRSDDRWDGPALPPAARGDDDRISKSTAGVSTTPLTIGIHRRHVADHCLLKNITPT